MLSPSHIIDSSATTSIRDTNIVLIGNEQGVESRVAGLLLLSSSSSKQIPSPVSGDSSHYQRLKLVKRGHSAAFSPMVCGVSFEALPAWLWSFRLSDWSSVVISETDAIRLQQSHVSTWTVWKDKFDIVDANLAVTLDAHKTVVWFSSGSRPFLEAVCRSGGNIPQILWLEGGGRRHPVDTRGILWFSVVHSRLGGVTTSRGTFGSRGIALDIPVDPLRRSLAHVVKYSERPTPCAIPVTAPHYSLDSLLCVRLAERPVLYPSVFSRTGWGIRKLVPTEFGQAFDLPSYLDWDVRFLSSLVPLHLFRVVGDAALLCIRKEVDCPRTVREKASLDLRIPDVVALESRADLPVWIQPLGLWLSGDWAKADIAEKAVKADNAEINRRPWNLRISLVFPQVSPKAIQGFERLCLRRWRFSLSRSFFTYLRSVYGSTWIQLLQAARRKRHAGLKRDCSELLASHDRIMGGSGSITSAAGPVADSLRRDVDCGIRVLSQVMSSEWWDWKRGSSLFFWRWNGAEQQVAARDGIPIFVASPLPTRRRQKECSLDAKQIPMVASKVAVMWSRDYLEAGHVTNSVHFFAVPKGDEDIRVVFDGTSSGLNTTLWAPNFFLPSAKSAAMVMCFSTWMSDMDFGEMFHNFNLDPRIRPYSGVNVAKLGLHIPSREVGPRISASKVTTLRWTRLFMGMRPSPYNAVRHYYWGEEFARGDPKRKSNPMGYNRIRLNLPGMADYDPSLPKVMKWRDGKSSVESGHVAGDVVTFIDDVRITGYSKENCHAVRRQFASRIQFLGMQDAPRKFRPPSQESAGAWTGTVFKVGLNSLTKSVSQEKWEKGRGIVEDLLKAVQNSKDGRPRLNRKSLERETGFMNHLAMTFETMTPFLKGFYLSLNSWRSGRDKDDWKVSSKKWKALLFSRHANGLMTDVELDFELSRGDGEDAPAEVIGSPSLRSDLESLQILIAPSTVPEVNIRSRSVVTVVYGFGDASGTGLGATFTCGSGFNFRIGVWGSDEDPESSNWKEFSNIVESLEDEASLDHLRNAEVFMFTDNSTVEACVAKGSSTSPKLLSLVVRLLALTSKVGVKINIIHVAGSRMIAQGTDGVSRGYLGQGVMAGDAMTLHIPIHQSAVERSPLDLVPWIRSWSGTESILLDEAGWFQLGHDIQGWSLHRDGFERPTLVQARSSYIWTPAPMAAEVAIAELRKARIKRQRSAHVFVCPRLCTSQWLKQLYRAADIVFELPLGFSCWPVSMHEPLLIGIVFPFISCSPWQIRGTPKMFAMGRELRRVLQESEVDAGNLLCKFWSLCIDIDGMPEHVVRKLLCFS